MSAPGFGSVARLLSAVAAMLFVLAASAQAETTFSVGLEKLTDQKAVFATVESPNVVPARAASAVRLPVCRCARATA